MSTSILYHAWGIVGYDYVSTGFVEGRIEFKIRHRPSKLCCSKCRSSNVILPGTKTRKFRGVPVGSKKVFFLLEVQRVECLVCGCCAQVDLRFADPHVSYTKGFERFALELLRFATIDDVARHLGISWDVVKDIQKRNLEGIMGTLV